jgi:polar amino acid transport system ATP-binding protein
MTSVRFRGVYKQYAERVVLKGVDLDVPAHHLLGVIGSSGSGKSTLVRCVNLLEQVDDGQIWLGEEDITEVSVAPDAVRRRVGMVFQSFNLFPHLTALQNVTLAARKVHRVPRAAANAKAADLLERFGLQGRESSYPDRLSGGQQQRVAFARSLMTDPEVLLLDEVTSALDPEIVGDILEIIRALKLSGMTMIMATHEMQFCREIADEVCFLDDGRVLELGPPEQVFTHPAQARTREFLRRVLQ